VPALQTEVRATSLASGFNNIPRGFWKVSTEVRATSNPKLFFQPYL
jgi:hypothetical protein